MIIIIIIIIIIIHSSSSSSITFRSIFSSPNYSYSFFLHFSLTISFKSTDITESHISKGNYYQPIFHWFEFTFFLLIKMMKLKMSRQ